MKITLIFLSVFLMCGCLKKTGLQLSDLKYGNIDKERIAANNVDTIYVISSNRDLNLGESDTFGYRTYDEKGNLLNEHLRIFFGHDVTYDYDRFKLIKNKIFRTDFTAKFKAIYRFVPDSLLLNQIWIYHNAVIDTCVFKFNNKGNVTTSLEYANDDCGKGEVDETLYEYDKSGLLIQKIINHLSIQEITNPEFMTRYPSKSITNYFYSGLNIDSTITTNLFQNYPAMTWFSKTFYNSNGLKIKTIDKDTIITNYAYTFR